MKISAFGHCWVLRWPWVLAVLAVAAVPAGLSAWQWQRGGTRPARAAGRSVHFGARTAGSRLGGQSIGCDLQAVAGVRGLASSYPQSTWTLARGPRWRAGVLGRPVGARDRGELCPLFRPVPGRFVLEWTPTSVATGVRRAGFRAWRIPGGASGVPRGRSARLLKTSGKSP